MRDITTITDSELQELFDFYRTDFAHDKRPPEKVKSWQRPDLDSLLRKVNTHNGWGDKFPSAWCHNSRMWVRGRERVTFAELNYHQPENKEGAKPIIEAMVAYAANARDYLDSIGIEGWNRPENILPLFEIWPNCESRLGEAVQEWPELLDPLRGVEKREDRPKPSDYLFSLGIGLGGGVAISLATNLALAALPIPPIAIGYINGGLGKPSRLHAKQIGAAAVGHYAGVLIGEGIKLLG